MTHENSKIRRLKSATEDELQPSGHFGRPYGYRQHLPHNEKPNLRYIQVPENDNLTKKVLPGGKNRQPQTQP